jgi:hypothetical protein
LDREIYFIINREKLNKEIPISLMPETANEILEKSIIYLIGALGFGISQLQEGNSIDGVSKDLGKYFVKDKNG